MKHNNHIPRQDLSKCKYHNVKLVGGHFDGMTVDNFQCGDSLIYVRTGILSGDYCCSYYKLDKNNPTVALVCDLEGNYV